MSATEEAPDLILGGTVQDMAGLPIHTKGEAPSPYMKSAQKLVLNGHGLEQSSITDP